MLGLGRLVSGASRSSASAASRFFGCSTLVASKPTGSAVNFSLFNQHLKIPGAMYAHLTTSLLRLSTLQLWLHHPLKMVSPQNALEKHHLDQAMSAITIRQYQSMVGALTLPLQGCQIEQAPSFGRSYSEHPATMGSTVTGSRGSTQILLAMLHSMCPQHCGPPAPCR